MIKWSLVYSRIAALHNSSTPYVAQIHSGARKVESPLSKRIALSLSRADKAAQKFQASVEAL